MHRPILATIALLLTGSSAFARGVSPYLPLSLSPEIERQIERLLILADVPVTARPVAAATVLDALPAACERDAAVCETVRRYLASYMRPAALTHVNAAIAGTSGPSTPLPNRHGMRSDSAYEVSAQGFWQPGDYLLINAGMLAYDDEVLPTGSVISGGFEYAQIDVGYRDHWYSPMTDSAMPIGTHAQTMPSITVSNYTPLTRAKLRYEFFLAEMSHSDMIRHNGGYTSGNPRLAGMHLSIEPLPGWSLAFNRLMQFGGGDRGGNSFNDFLKAFFRPNKNDNTGTADEFGNQVASITTRLLIPGPKPFAVYAEYAGEDTSRSTDWRLGNANLGIGIHFANLLPRLDWRFELSEWQNGWYEHGIYQDGLRNEGDVIGHWAADWRDTDVGARAAMTQFGWEAGSRSFLQLTYRTVQNEQYSATPYERGHDLRLIYSYKLQDWRVGGEANLGRDVYGDTYSRVSAFVRF